MPSYRVLLLLLGVVLHFASSAVIVDRQLGDVSISPSRSMFKKRLQGPSLAPFLREQNLVTKVDKIVRSVKSTTPASTTTSQPKAMITLPHSVIYGFHTQRDLGDFYRNFPEFFVNGTGTTASKSDQEFELITYPTVEQDWPYGFKNRNHFNDHANRPNRVNNRLDNIYDANYPVYDRNHPVYDRNHPAGDRGSRLNRPVDDRGSSMNRLANDRGDGRRPGSDREGNRSDRPLGDRNNRPVNDRERNSLNRPVNEREDNINRPLSDRRGMNRLNDQRNQQLNHPMKNEKKTHYRIGVIEQPNYSATNENEVDPEPVIRFVEQFKCDLNVSTCGLKNDPQLKDMFYFEEIQDVHNRQRCFVADTDRARWAQMYGARLITRYFHTFAMPDACFELIYFANGPGVVEMTVAQQDKDTEVIWRLRNAQFNVELNFQEIRRQKIPVKLGESDPRFFISVSLDPNRIGRIGILGFNFSYEKCKSE